jgi:multiple sugar transport system permease protein
LPSNKALAAGGAGALPVASRSAPSVRRLNWSSLRRHSVPYLLTAPALLVMCGVLVYPLASVFRESLYRVEPALSPDWSFVSLHNYSRILADPDVAGSLGHTAVWTVGSVVLQVALGLGAAVALAKAFRGRGLVRAALMVPWATPAVVGALAWKWIYHGQYGLLNSALRGLHLDSLAVAWLGDPHTAMNAVIVANVWRGFPFITVVLLAGVLAIPRELYEAAAVDGASGFGAFRRVTLPLLKPALLISSLLAAIWTFNNFAYIYILTGGGPAGQTDILVTFVYRNGFQLFHWGYASALSVFLFFLVLACSLIYIRLLRSESLES